MSAQYRWASCVLLSMNAIGFAANADEARSEVVSEARFRAVSPSAQSAESKSPTTTAIGEESAGSEAVPYDVIPVNEVEETGASETPKPKINRNRVIEEIIVTAQKREERIQDVPISIQAFSGDALSARGVENTAELGQAIPSLQFTGVGGFELIFLRGVGTDNFVPSADPSVATYIDGIYVPNIQGATNSLGNIQRVEVLKGPQGTLFGRNSTGGAISITTESPGDTVRVSTEVEGSNYSGRSIKASASGPITDWLGIGLSGVYSKQDSYYKNINYETQASKLSAYRLKLAFHPTDNLSIDLTGMHVEQQGISTTIGKNTNPSLLGRTLQIQPQRDDYVSQSDYEAGSEPTQKILYGILTWKLPLIDLKLLGSHEDISTSEVFVDFDGSPLPLVGFHSIGQYSKPETAELQILSNADTPFSDNFKWVFGLYYLHNVAGVDPVQFQVAPHALQSALDLLDVTAPDALNDLFELNAAALSLSGVLETKSYSAYTQGTYTFTDWLDLTIGGRFQHENRFLTKASTSAVVPASDETVTLLPFELSGRKENNFSPKGVLGFHPAADQLVYVSYTTGFKSGTFNIVNIYTPPNYIVPEKVTTYEIGAKLQFLDGLLRLNGAVFNNEIDNLQSGFVSLLSGGAVQFLTVPAARTRGIEFDGTIVPFPEIDAGLALTANFAYIDATYTDFPSGPGFQKGTGLYSADLDLTGKRLVRTPKYSGGLGLVQNVNLTNGALEFAVDGYYNSGFYYDAYNSVKENRYKVFNGHASYLYEPWNVRLTAFGKNVLGEKYHVQQFQTDFGIIKTLAPPREYGLRLGWEF